MGVIIMTLMALSSFNRQRLAWPATASAAELRRRASPDEKGALSQHCG